MADLTTTATGATNVGIGVKEMYDLLKPSASLARGTKELQSAIFLLRDEKFNIPSTVVLELWIKYESLNARGKLLRSNLDASWSTSREVIKKKICLPFKARSFAREANDLHNEVKISSADAASQNIGQQFGGIGTVAQGDLEGITGAPSPAQTSALVAPISLGVIASGSWPAPLSFRDIQRMDDLWAALEENPFADDKAVPE
ncbi:hypothetical protein NLI96_g7810 [Meripilus lineatus]|uniref:Uncharacterized protein n=1 Tax=Meripilus lineatus TaxID=2056292 RepID=A0AAD5YBP3_9APHY|nr:hypothetical protein NLI96_g7810 [Physisporinus lineatus]